MVCGALGCVYMGVSPVVCVLCSFVDCLRACSSLHSSLSISLSFFIFLTPSIVSLFRESGGEGESVLERWEGKEMGERREG